MPIVCHVFSHAVKQKCSSKPIVILPSTVWSLREIEIFHPSFHIRNTKKWIMILFCSQFWRSGISKITIKPIQNYQHVLIVWFGCILNSIIYKHTTLHVRIWVLKLWHMKYPSKSTANKKPNKAQIKDPVKH